MSWKEYKSMRDELVGLVVHNEEHYYIKVFSHAINEILRVGFEVLTAVSMKIAVFWVDL
jgi:hypothetical protein